MLRGASQNIMMNPGQIIVHDPKGDYSFYDAAKITDRLYANICDTFLVGVIAEMMQIFVETYISKMVHPVYLTPIAVVAYFSVILFYYVIPMKKYGATIGKRAFNLKVIYVHTSKNLSIWSIYVREFIGKMISLFFPLFFLIGAFRPDGRTLHDFMGKTRVIKLK